MLRCGTTGLASFIMFLQPGITMRDSDDIIALGAYLECRVWYLVTGMSVIHFVRLDPSASLRVTNCMSVRVT